MTLVQSIYIYIISTSGTTDFFRTERLRYNIRKFFGVIRLWWAVKNFQISPQEEEVDQIRLSKEIVLTRMRW